MTNQQRTLVTCVVLLCATALSAVGLAVDSTNASVYVGGVLTLAGTILGYTFGRQNGEKALAAAIVQAATNAADPRSALDVAVEHSTPTASKVTTVTVAAPAVEDEPEHP